MRKVLICLILFSFTFWFPYAFKRWTHAFRPAKCLIEWPFVPEWETKPLENPDILACLQEPFSYLTKGAQSYVFLSRDEKYVLKLFRYDTCRIPLGQKLERNIRKWIGAREKHFLPTEVKIAKNFNSCQLAYTLAPKQTGVVFVHLNPKKSQLPILKLKDRFGRTHHIDPAQYRFVLQRKADPFIKSFYSQPIQPLVDSYLSLLQELKDLGLVNLDSTMGRNFGFLDGRAVVIDIGNFTHCPEKAALTADHFEKQLYRWLERRKLL